jgi:uncharacterized protein YegP (UPF0339 family)
MKTPKYLAVVFRDIGKQWRWSIVSRNQHIVATSSEAYHNKGDCLRVLKRILAAGATMPIEFYTRSGK